MKIVYVDMDGVVADFTKKWELMYGRELSKSQPIPPTPAGFYRDLELITGAYESIKLLQTKFDVYFLSTAEWDNPTSFTDKRLWVEEKFGESAKKKLILSHNKSLNIGDYLIDDRTLNGASEFTGGFIHFGSTMFPDWKSVITWIWDKESFV